MLHSNARAFRLGFSVKRENPSSAMREILERSWGSFFSIVVLVAMLVRRRDRARVVKDEIGIEESILDKGWRYR